MTSGTPAASEGDGVRARLQRRLRDAMKARDTTATAALRATLGAIGNAEAVATPDAEARTPIGDGPIAGAVRGLGAAEADRRVLDEADVEAIVRHEIVERIAAADEYERLGRTAEAAELREHAGALQQVLDHEASM